MVLTLGNRRVDNQEIRFDLFNDSLVLKIRSRVRFDHFKEDYWQKNAE